MAHESSDQPAAVLPQLQQVFPVQLGYEHPHGQLGFGAVLEIRNEPFRVMFAVKEVFGVQMCRQSGTAAVLAWQRGV
jgi:hypothetical protein